MDSAGATGRLNCRRGCRCLLSSKARSCRQDRPGQTTGNRCPRPVLIVNAGEISPIENDAHCQTLLQEIDSAQCGKRYFNRSPLAID